MANEKRQGERLEKFFEKLFDVTVYFFRVLIKGAVNIPFKRVELYIIWGLIGYSCYLITFNRWIFYWCSLFRPKIFGVAWHEQMAGGNLTLYWGIMVVVLFFSYVLLLGSVDIAKQKRMQRKLDELLLRAGKDNRPRVLRVKSIGPSKKIVTILSPGIGVDNYQKRIGDIESAFGEYVEKVTTGANPRFIEIHLTQTIIPTRCSYRDYFDKALAPYSFIVGESQEGIVTKKITELPHLLIAGTTGGGKSVFFKQVLLGLLHSSPHLQMYLLDLKGGLEMKVFSTFPNVRVQKDIASSLKTLAAIELEMNRRFQYLEQKGHKEIIPQRDKLDRIVVGVDESSLLYGIVQRGSKDYSLVMKAREITDKIAKLGRAAGIHLILATQKITKETIGTSIQENVTGRMCFRMNTLPGSLVVLGNKAAMNLPENPGRGIWLCGNQQREIQAPFVDDEDITATFELMKLVPQETRKGNFQELLEISKLSKEVLANDYASAQKETGASDQKAQC